LQLKYQKEDIRQCKDIAEIYDKELEGIMGIRHLKQHPKVDYSYPYYPIFVDAKKYGKSRNELYNYLKSNNIFGRRYFYPLVSEFPMYKNLDSAKPDNLPNAHKIAEQVICLPIYPDLGIKAAKRVVKLVKSNIC